MRAFRQPLLLPLALLAFTAVGAEEKAPAAKEKEAPAKAKAADPKEKATVAPPPLSPRFQQVRDRIHALYGNRDEPPPPPDPRYNPFRTQPLEPTPAAPSRTAGTPEVAASTVTAPTTPLLKQAAALLKITGFVVRDGRTLLNINQALYKEGDIIKVAVKGQPVLLRVKKLSRSSLTVALDSEETTLNF